MKTHEQYRIDLERDGVRILGAVISYGGGLTWSQRMMAHVLRCPEGRVEAAVSELEALGYMRQYRPTAEGREYYSGALAQSASSISVHEWRREVLSGVAQRSAGRRHADWQRTSIDNAVLPGQPSRPANEQTPERILEEVQRSRLLKRRLCNRLGIDMYEYDRRVADGSLHQCKGHDGVPHIGIFDRQGKGWRYLCKVCRQRKRSNKKGTR